MTTNNILDLIFDDKFNLQDFIAEKHSNATIKAIFTQRGLNIVIPNSGQVNALVRDRKYTQSALSEIWRYAMSHLATSVTPNLFDAGSYISRDASSVSFKSAFLSYISPTQGEKVIDISKLALKGANPFIASCARGMSCVMKVTNKERSSSTLDLPFGLIPKAEAQNLVNLIPANCPDNLKGVEMADKLYSVLSEVKPQLQQYRVLSVVSRTFPAFPVKAGTTIQHVKPVALTMGDKEINSPVDITEKNMEKIKRARHDFKSSVKTYSYDQLVRVTSMASGILSQDAAGWCAESVYSGIPLGKMWATYLNAAISFQLANIPDNVGVVVGTKDSSLVEFLKGCFPNHTLCGLTESYDLKKVNMLMPQAIKSSGRYTVLFSYEAATPTASNKQAEVVANSEEYCHTKTYQMQILGLKHLVCYIPLIFVALGNQLIQTDETKLLKVYIPGEEPDFKKGSKYGIMHPSQTVKGFSGVLGPKSYGTQVLISPFIKNVPFSLLYNDVLNYLNECMWSIYDPVAPKWKGELTCRLEARVAATSIKDFYLSSGMGEAQAEDLISIMLKNDTLMSEPEKDESEDEDSVEEDEEDEAAQTRGDKRSDATTETEKESDKKPLDLEVGKDINHKEVLKKKAQQFDKKPLSKKERKKQNRANKGVGRQQQAPKSTETASPNSAILPEFSNIFGDYT